MQANATTPVTECDFLVDIRRYTHTMYQRSQMQERTKVIVKGPVRQRGRGIKVYGYRQAALKAGCPRSAKTMIVGWYTTEIEFRDLPKDQTVRNWTEWHVTLAPKTK